MSLNKALARFGVNNKRFVTTTGLVVFDGVTKTTDGYTHARHGHVTAVEPARFHGGEDPEDTAEQRWWLTQPEDAQRHADAVADAFPGFTYIAGDDEHPPAFAGTLNSGFGVHEILILLRSDRGLPFVVIPNRRLGKQRGRHWRRAPHLYDSGALCVAGRDDWNPDQHTAATVIAWTAHWLAAYVFWLADSQNRWPTEGQDVA